MCIHNQLEMNLHKWKMVIGLGVCVEERKKMRNKKKQMNVESATMVYMGSSCTSFQQNIFS